MKVSTLVPIIVVTGVILNLSLSSCGIGGNSNRNLPAMDVQVLREGKYTRHIVVDGLERTYLIFVPKTFNPTQPPPLILAFHGGFGDSETFASVTGLGDQGNAAGYVVVFLNGVGRSWNARDCCGTSQKANVDDVGFVKKLLTDLAVVAPYNSQQVFAVGFSNGGEMTYRLACELADRISAIAVVSATLAMKFENCKPVRPVPVLHIHGLADTYVPFNGGLSAYKAAGIQPSVPDTITFWSMHNGCNNESSVISSNEIVNCTTFSDCQQGADVRLCVISDLAHQWPGGEVRLASVFGSGTQSYSASDRIIEFFNEQTRLSAAKG